MAYSEVQICNLALSRVGVLALINDLSEDSAEGRACNLLYGPSRDYVLANAKWPFATRYAALGQVAVNPCDDWGYSYRYPVDCVLAMRLVLAPGRIYTPSPPYAIGGDAFGTLLLCDLADATLQYVSAQTNAGVFGDTLVSAIAWRLASEIAIPLGRDQSLRANAENRFKEDMAKAASNAFNEQQMDAEPPSSFEQARHNGGWPLPSSYGPTR